ncbi:TetR/AcrR family transcriptional regulator [Actinosynnema pretiosum subsp. pretiosum]|uniref:TetR/AcrR family transcriptional regulator n=1 Tax=Actinosynnema pretiosum subsp. pretiosum TaxID=103721 RepID=A0AA45L5X4_9PSEU|nr:Transcriptional regulator, TetR family [Actinosynnema pretiosum subsp. pretiosum]QUF03415.1 TetR/AcrR family transcriptional regulator [Actinosynnema pretiosum subsp. pretiosum]
MSAQQRRERERAERRGAIVGAARELAEAEGWEAVTTRRLAELIEYSQPVLYSHFSGKGAIIAAVAVEGFAELAERLGGADGLVGLARAYTGFAEDNPACYDAMFTLSAPLAFDAPDTPQPLRDAFTALRDVLAPLRPQGDPDVFTEVVWGALHGQVLLARGGRLPEARRDARLAALVELAGARP